MADLVKAAELLNIIGRFCARRDIETLTSAALRERYGINKADALVLFGGSIAGGFDVAAQGWLNGVADRLILAGGAGHTTETLRQTVKNNVPELATAGKSEAQIMAEYLKLKYGIAGAYLETASTNCGNNVTNVLALLREKNIAAQHIIIMQDGSMQRRMAAGFDKYAPNLTVINFAVYQAALTVQNGELVYAKPPFWGMWTVERYITLLMGEIPRLADNADGYGPSGHNFIAHVTIPDDVWNAFNDLKTHYGDYIRAADAKYKT